MTTEKESLGFKIFWFILSAVYKFGLTYLVLLNTEFKIETIICFSFLIAVFWAKNEIDKQDLENKIFELKEIIKNSKNYDNN